MLRTLTLPVAALLMSLNAASPTIAQEIAPICEQCGVRILGHGMEAGDRFYCCDHCAEQEGVDGLNDRV